jgi:hypothetical protein
MLLEHGHLQIPTGLSSKNSWLNLDPSWDRLVAEWEEAAVVLNQLSKQHKQKLLNPRSPKR